MIKRSRGIRSCERWLPNLITPTRSSLTLLNFVPGTDYLVTYPLFITNRKASNTVNYKNKFTNTRLINSHYVY